MLVVVAAVHTFLVEVPLGQVVLGAAVLVVKARTVQRGQEIRVAVAAALVLTQLVIQVVMAGQA